MHREVIKELLDRTPFHPFKLKLVDGTIYEIPGRDYVSLFPNGRTMLVFLTEDRFKFVDTALVLEVDSPTEKI